MVDSKFWRIVKSLGEASLQSVEQDTLALLDTITYMKEAGILSNKAMRIVSQLIHNLDTLSAHQLVDFTLMYSSSEMQSAIDISEHISKLEEALLTHKGEFSLDSFAAICSVVSFDDAGKGSLDNFTVSLPIFMHENLEQVQQWLDQDAFTEMHVQDLVFVAAAYISMYDDGEIPEALMKSFENAVLANSLNIDAHQAINLVRVFS